MRTETETVVGTTIIKLMRGVVYRETDEESWLTLSRHAGPVRDHFATIGVEVVVDDTEGYAYLKSREEADDEAPLPRLVRRRTLGYQVSLLLVLLRKRLAEFESDGDAGMLVLTRDQIVELLQVFLAGSTNDAKVVDTIDSAIKKAEELGFLRQLRGQPGHWEVRRVLKAYVDAQTMADFDTKLAEYAGTADD